MALSWLALAILDAFFAALVAIFAKIGLQDVDPNLATAVRTAIMMAFMAGVVIFTGKFEAIGEITSRQGLFIVLSGVAGAISWLLYFSALKVGETSKVAAVDRASLLFVIVMSYMVLGEGITLRTALAGGLIFLGLLIIAL
ncbi:MAG TPA: EamA family transporter [Methanotrichaceae archaeon]|nr:EamA family transporter [Methanotrichaceae archaeon]